MFGGGPTQREFDVKGLERYVKRRLETLFPKVFEPLALPVDKAPLLIPLDVAHHSGMISPTVPI